MLALREHDSTVTSYSSTTHVRLQPQTTLPFLAARARTTGPRRRRAPVRPRPSTAQRDARQPLHLPAGTEPRRQQGATLLLAAPTAAAESGPHGLQRHGHHSEALHPGGGGLCRRDDRVGPLDQRQAHGAVAHDGALVSAGGASAYALCALCEVVLVDRRWWLQLAQPRPQSILREKKEKVARGPTAQHYLEPGAKAINFL